MQESPEAKKPCKGILKTSSSFDRPGASYRKSAKFDELNVLQTYHPLDKDYGHMKIDEPKTPFNYIEQGNDQPEELDADLLAEKLRIAAKTQTPSFDDEDDVSDEEFPETEDEKVRRVEFERRRKAHYNEFEAVRLARKLMEEELEEDDDEDELAADEDSKAKVASEHPDSDEQTSRDGEEKSFEEQSKGTAKSESEATTGESTSANPGMDVDQCGQADKR